MFDEMPDQFYQFLAATSRTTNNITTHTSSTPTNIASLPLSFSLHHPNFPPPPPPPQQQQPTNFDASYFVHHPQLPLHQAKQDQTVLAEPVLPWSNEEVLALLKIRSAMDNPWFPAEFTWDNVSRKLGEVGFKRSAESCKEKFEEETRSFNNIVINNNCSSSSNNNNNNNSNNNKNSNVISQNYRLFGELEELYSNTTTNGDKGNVNDHNQEQNSDDELNECADASNENENENENENDEGGIQENVEKTVGGEKSGNGETGVRDEDDLEEEEDDGGKSVGGDSEKTEENTKKGRKRKRQKKFELFKGFCEKIVNQMMAKQEEFHCKILQDMVKRDEDKNSREDAWKRQEIDRITKELEVRAHEQAIVGDREAKILGFLKKFSSSSTRTTTTNNVSGNVRIKVPNVTTTTTLSTSSIYLSQDSISAITHDQNSISNLVNQQKCNLLQSAPQSLDRMENQKLGLPMLSSTMNQCSKNPNPGISSENDLSTRLTSISTTTHKSFVSNNHTSTDATGQVIMDVKSLDNHTGSKHDQIVVKDDTGRRWPRDEVLALINIRCSLFNNNGDHLHDKESLSKGPLWERISQKMMELGYNRSSKRCKEKWENINKYFRKTKDLNKKRSIDSRTCPYFHQLSHLYNQGAPLHGQSDRSVSLVDSPDNQSMALSGAQGGSST